MTHTPLVNGKNNLKKRIAEERHPFVIVERRDKEGHIIGTRIAVLEKQLHASRTTV